MQTQTPEKQNQIYDFLLHCGNEHDPYGFCSVTAKELHHLIPYEQARVIFLDVTGKISSSLLFGVDKQDWQNFLNYYSEDCIGSRYSLKEPLRLSENERVALCDWTNLETRKAHDLFESSYVRPLQLKYCLGMSFCDQHACTRCIISLDRTRDVPYREDELALLRKLNPLLNNYFINFFTDRTINLNQQDFMFSEYGLTNRETEIARLILDGATPASIAERLCISVATAYKHLANMYGKMKVSNRQEFVTRLCGRPV